MRDDLHPEELLTQASRRALTRDEDADLRAHLERCPACALQVDLRGEVARALAPTDTDYELGARSVERVLASGDWASLPLPPVRSAARERPPLVARAAIVVLMLLGTGVGASALVLRARSRLHPMAGPAAASQTLAARLGSQRGRVARVVPPLIEESARPAAAVDSLAPAASPPAAATSPAVEVPVVRARAKISARVDSSDDVLAGDTPLLGALPATAPSSSTTPPAIAAPATQAESAAVLFGAAERARSAGDAREAERLFGRLASAFPGSREELTSRVLRGQLLLDDLGRLDDALASFEWYLSAQPGGALAEEARAGRAETLRRLGRPREEAAAWSELLTLHPRSVHAARARTRLTALHGE